jgi:hypothetical protein
MEESVDFGAFFVRFPDKVEEFFGQAYGQERWQRIKYALALPYVNFLVFCCCYELK